MAAAAPPPVVPVPFPTAVLNAPATQVFSSATEVSGQPGARQVVIDPLVNGVTGEQSAATRQIGEQLVPLARMKYPLDLMFSRSRPPRVSKAP